MANLYRPGHGCRFCATGGIDYDAPALVYVVLHRQLGAVKVGVTGAGLRYDRIHEHQRHGWDAYRSQLFDTGELAERTEQAVIAQLRARGLQPFLSATDMPQRGWTETFARGVLPEEEMWKLVQTVAE
ncbi:hypothetical protein ACFFWE_17060 [Sphaerisporangium melleum]|nr:hypothetical protein [Sphaerisporangium melleum]